MGNEVFDASKLLVSIPFGERVTSELDKRILLLDLFGDRYEVIAWSAAMLIEIAIVLERSVFDSCDACCPKKNFVACRDTSRPRSALVNGILLPAWKCVHIVVRACQR